MNNLDFNKEGSDFYTYCVQFVVLVLGIDVLDIRHNVCVQCLKKQ